MNATEFYRPIARLLEPARLAQKRVAVIGLGSGGSRVASDLGRLGVQLFLIDRPGERLEEHNIVRHVLGYRSLGKSKTAEMACYIRNLNPAVAVQCCSLEVVARQALFAKRMAAWHPDLIAVCTDNEASKHAINEVALRLQIPQTGGAVYDGGVGGEVYRVRPGEACYGCLATQLQLERHAPRQSGPDDYTNPREAEAPLTSALGLDVTQIALLQCRLSLDLLLEQENGTLPSEVNLCVFANRMVPGVFARPFHAEFFHVHRSRDCLCCGAAPGNVAAEAVKLLARVRRRSAVPMHESSAHDHSRETAPVTQPPTKTGTDPVANAQLDD